MFTVNPFSVSRSYKVLTKPENFYPVHRPNFTFIGNFVHQFSPPWQRRKVANTFFNRKTNSLKIRVLNGGSSEPAMIALK